MSYSVSTEELAHKIKEMKNIKELKRCLLQRDKHFGKNMFPQIHFQTYGKTQN